MFEIEQEYKNKLLQLSCSKKNVLQLPNTRLMGGFMRNRSWCYGLRELGER
ncbi:hypothetical protein CHISP_1141 [Chitinispirillum alkaliphilum]|nr:hypothetical protein CHISP_1141 [Chitinispirillum alkaliphilum]